MVAIPVPPKLLQAPKVITLDEKMGSLSLVERDTVLALKKVLSTPHINVRIPPSYLGMVNGFLNGAIGRAGRLAFYSFVFDRKVEHGKIGVEHGLQVYEAFNLTVWLQPVKLESPLTGWEYRGRAKDDIHILIRLFSEGVGQLAMEL